MNLRRILPDTSSAKTKDALSADADPTMQSVHRGRSLDASRDVVLRETAIELLAEIGYDRLTMDAVAARAHASKATIYRRWPDKAALVVDALNCMKGSMTIPDTGSLIGDLTAITQWSTNTENRADARLMLGLMTSLAHDPSLRAAFQERIVEPRTRLLREVFARAVTRGEISADRNIDMLATLYPSMLFRRLMVTGELPDRQFSVDVMNDVILPLATAHHDSPTLT